MSKKKKILVFIIAVLAASQAISLAVFFYLNRTSVKKAELGVTFSSWHARYLGLDAGAVLAGALEDLKIKNYRIPVYWNISEQKKGKYDFSDVDWQLDKIEKEGGKAFLAIGRRLPRWPECHVPDWAKGLDEKTQQAAILKMLVAAVTHFENRAVVVGWQVENEPMLGGYGECPPPDTAFFKKEVDLVRSLDSRQIIITESGELSTWAKAAELADKIGISIYRTVWSPPIGLFTYPLYPAYYRYRAKMLAPFVEKIFVSELQVEPWGYTALVYMPISEQKAIMNEKKARQSVKFAKRAGFDEIYLWGVEWWAYLKAQGDSGMWDTIREIVTENQ